MKTVIISVVAIAIILGANVGIKKFLEANKPEAEKKEREEKLPVVEIEVLRKSDLEFSLFSEGVVTTRRETILSAEVPGRIVEVHPQFEVGMTFQAGEVVAQIDRLNFETAVAQAKSAAADAELNLVQERARATQAARDWKNIGGGKEASDLVLRGPFLRSAEAKVEAAEAALAQAKKDLKRTAIRAPFKGRMRQVSLNVGATVAPGTQLGRIYDHERLMVRLPFSLDDYAQIPEDPEIKLWSEIGGRTFEWEGEVMWSLGEVDQATVSAYLLVQVLANEEASSKFRLPATGQFLTAKVGGSVLPNVVPVPRLAIQGRDRVGVLNRENQLEYRTLEIGHSDEDFVYATAGVVDGDKAIVTKLEVPVEGMSLVEAKAEESELR